MQKAFHDRYGAMAHKMIHDCVQKSSNKKYANDWNFMKFMAHALPRAP